MRIQNSLQNFEAQNWKDSSSLTKLILSGFLIVFTVFLSFSQDLASFADKGIIFNEKDLNDIEYTERTKILNFDFDGYRSYEGQSHVQIVNGPQIKLSSIKEMLSNGASVDNEVIERKKNQTSTKNNVIYRVDVGLYRNSVDQLDEKWNSNK